MKPPEEPFSNKIAPSVLVLEWEIVATTVLLSPILLCFDSEQLGAITAVLCPHKHTLLLHRGHGAATPGHQCGSGTVHASFHWTVMAQALPTCFAVISEMAVLDLAGIKKCRRYDRYYFTGLSNSLCNPTKQMCSFRVH